MFLVIVYFLCYYCVKIDFMIGLKFYFIFLYISIIGNKDF